MWMGTPRNDTVLSDDTSAAIRRPEEVPGASDLIETESRVQVPRPAIQRRLQGRLNALGPAPLAELLHVVVLPDFERADAIASHPSKGDWTGVVTADTATTARSALDSPRDEATLDRSGAICRASSCL